MAPDEDASKEVAGNLVKVCGDASEVLKSAKHAFGKAAAL
jgi:hypothetical protein